MDRRNSASNKRAQYTQQTPLAPNMAHYFIETEKAETTVYAPRGMVVYMLLTFGPMVSRDGIEMLVDALDPDMEPVIIITDDAVQIRTVDNEVLAHFAAPEGGAS